MWIVTFSGGRSNIAAREEAWSTVWNCSPFHTSSPSAVHVHNAVHRLHRRVGEVGKS